MSLILAAREWWAWMLFILFDGQWMVMMKDCWVLFIVLPGEGRFGFGKFDKLIRVSPFLPYIDFGSYTKYLPKFLLTRCGWRMREVRLENGVRGVDRLNNGEPRHLIEIGLRDPRGLVWCPSGSPPGEPILIWNPSWSYRCPSWSLLVGLVPRLGLTRLQTTQDPFRRLLLPDYRPTPLSWVTLGIV